MPTFVWIILGVVVVLVLVVAFIQDLFAMNRHNRVKKDGEEVIIWMIMANTVLFESGDEASAPSTVLVPGDPEDGYDVEFMTALVGKTTLLLSGTRKPKEDERRYYREVKNELYRPGLWVKLPKSWTAGGSPVYLSQLLLWRECLPKGRIRRGRGYFRAAVIYDEPELGVAHIKYHPDDNDDGPYYDRRKRKVRRESVYNEDD